MNGQSFSERHGFVPPPEPIPYDEVPPWVRSEVGHMFRALAERLEDKLYDSLRPLIWKVLQRNFAGTPIGGPWAYSLQQLVDACNWWQFYDVCEEVYKLIARRCGQPDAEIFAQEVNDLFIREAMVWRFTAGRMERAYNPLVTQKLEEVRTLLQGPRFRGADEQFEKALHHLNERPEPDKENCVKDAIGALEAIARIVSANHKAILPDILGKGPFRSGIHPALRVAIEKLYAYRGDVGGAAHGQVGPSEVGVEEAEWILMMAAGTILYLANKFGEPTK